MTTCPKCGHHDIGGPSYRGAEPYLYQGERLVYWCRRCGYEESRPTKDAPKDPAELLAELARRGLRGEP